MTSDAYHKLVRLYLPERGFAQGAVMAVSEGQAHYLRNVMRLQPGDHLRVFNGHDGEWFATVTEIGKRGAAIELTRQLLPQKDGEDVWVLASPVRKEAFDLMTEKASELGAARFLPVICDHTVVHRVNRERAQALAIEAAEQCERHDVMDVAELSELKKILAAWDGSRKLVFCLERKEAQPILQALQQIDGPCAVLIGPEGGFSEAEVEAIKAMPFAIPVSLGPRILRAETALIAALACLQGSRDIK